MITSNVNLNLMRQWIQVIQLTITGKKAKAYIYPFLSLRWRSNFRLKPANEHPEIISSSKIFHSFATLLPKENLATSNLSLYLFNFNDVQIRCGIAHVISDFRRRIDENQQKIGKVNAKITLTQIEIKDKLMSAANLSFRVECTFFHMEAI